MSGGCTGSWSSTAPRIPKSQAATSRRSSGGSWPMATGRSWFATTFRRRSTKDETILCSPAGLNISTRSSRSSAGGLAALVLKGGMSKNARQAIVDQLAQPELVGTVLVATAASLARALTARHSTPCFWRSPSDSRAASSSTSVGSYGRHLTRHGLSYTITSTWRFPRSRGCTTSAPADTPVWVSARPRSRRVVGDYSLFGRAIMCEPRHDHGRYRRGSSSLSAASRSSTDGVPGCRGGCLSICSVVLCRSCRSVSIGRATNLAAKGVCV